MDKERGKNTCPYGVYIYDVNKKYPLYNRFVSFKLSKSRNEKLFESYTKPNTLSINKNYFSNVRTLSDTF